MSAFESIKQGLTEAMAFAEDRESGAVVHQIEVPTVDVAAIRASTGLSQAAFAPASASPKAPCQAGNTAAAARPAPPKCSSP